MITPLIPCGALWVLLVLLAGGQAVAANDLIDKHVLSAAATDKAPVAELACDTELRLPGSS